MNRALAPYPPVAVSFDGDLTPASVVNSDPVAVVWKKRDRRKTKISFPEDADEPVESGIEYCVRHGPPGFKTTTVIGDDTDTTGEFALEFKGSSTVEFFARKDGIESNAFTFDTVALNGAGASIYGSIGTVNVLMNITVVAGVSAVGALPTIHILFATPVETEILDMPTITLTAPNATVSAVADNLGGLPVISLSEVEATAEEQQEAIGSIGTITVTAIEGEFGDVWDVGGGDDWDVDGTNDWRVRSGT